MNGLFFERNGYHRHHQQHLNTAREAETSQRKAQIQTDLDKMPNMAAEQPKPRREITMTTEQHAGRHGGLDRSARRGRRYWLAGEVEEDARTP